MLSTQLIKYGQLRVQLCGSFYKVEPCIHRAFSRFQLTVVLLLPLCQILDLCSGCGSEIPVLTPVLLHRSGYTLQLQHSRPGILGTMCDPVLILHPFFQLQLIIIEMRDPLSRRVGIPKRYDHTVFCFGILRGRVTDCGRGGEAFTPLKASERGCHICRRQHPCHNLSSYSHTQSPLFNLILRITSSTDRLVVPS